jgi:hypothetical protein
MTAAERIRQYAEVVLTVVARQMAGDPSASLTALESGATVSAGSEVEPPKHLTTEYDQ